MSSVCCLIVRHKSCSLDTYNASIQELFILISVQCIHTKAVYVELLLAMNRVDTFEFVRIICTFTDLVPMVLPPCTRRVFLILRLELIVCVFICLDTFMLLIQRRNVLRIQCTAAFTSCYTGLILSNFIHLLIRKLFDRLVTA